MRMFRRWWGSAFGVALFLISAVSAAPICFADGSGDAPAWPAWMSALSHELKSPDSLPDELRQSCEDRILAALNARFGVRFSTTDVALVDVPGWAQPERAFMRGGAYNIRIVAGGFSQTELQRIKSGRFIGHLDGIPDDLKPSLHLPKKIKDNLVFNSTFANGTGSVDFVAHIDTAYAYSPLGFLVHMFRDVVGSKGRNPCP